MTEDQLRQRVLKLARESPEDGGTPWVEVVVEQHPDGYSEGRSAVYDRVLGDVDKVFRPALGVPWVEVRRYPPVDRRPFWCYLSDGMSDFPQVAGDGSGVRTELLVCARRESSLAVNLVHTLAAEPFRTRSACRESSAELPAGLCYRGFAHVLLMAPPLVPDLAGFSLGARPFACSRWRHSTPENTSGRSVLSRSSASACPRETRPS